MKCLLEYVIMPVGKNDASVHGGTQKAPEVAALGLFYSVLDRWLKPKAYYQLFFLSSHLQMRWQITPAIIERINDTSKSMMSPPFPTCIGVVA